MSSSICSGSSTPGRRIQICHLVFTTSAQAILREAVHADKRHFAHAHLGAFDDVENQIALEPQRVFINYHVRILIIFVFIEIDN